MRVFLDTNVLVSAFASRGLCADLFELVLLEHDLVLGDQVIAEFSRALTRKVKLPEAIAREIVEFVSGEALLVATDAQAINVKVGRADARVLGEAVFARAEVFVTGDAVLQKLGKLAEMEIVSPRGLWELLRS